MVAFKRLSRKKERLELVVWSMVTVHRKMALNCLLKLHIALETLHTVFWQRLIVAILLNFTISTTSLKNWETLRF